MIKERGYDRIKDKRRAIEMKIAEHIPRNEDEWKQNVMLIPESEDNSYLSDAFPRIKHNGKRYRLGVILQEEPRNEPYVYYLTIDHIDRGGLDLGEITERAKENGVVNL